MQFEMLLLTCIPLKNGLVFHHIRRLLACHFPFVKIDPSLHNQLSLHNNYYGSVQTINLFFPYGQSPRENASRVHVPTMMFYY
jgi:hypothetical protein